MGNSQFLTSFFLVEEMGVSRENTGVDSGTNFAEILSNALPQSHLLDKNKEKSSDSSVSIFEFFNLIRANLEKQIQLLLKMRPRNYTHLISCN